MIKIGERQFTNNLKDIYLGNNLIYGVFIGEKEVWRASILSKNNDFYYAYTQEMVKIAFLHNQDDFIGLSNIRFRPA